MKKIISSVAAGTMMAVAFFGVNSFLMAAGGSGDVLQKLSIPTSEQNILDLNIERAHAQQTADAKNPVCYDNYQSWSSSSNYKGDADWSTGFAVRLDVNPYRTMNHFERDINGDGLVDYVHIERNGYNTTVNAYGNSYECVYLSNGRGWDLAYRCVTRATGGTSPTITFYGDCADI